MSELDEAGAVEAPEGGSPPVEAAPAEASPAPSESASSSSLVQAESSGEEAAPVSYPSADDFGWDGWDGEVGTLPEMVQPWGTKLNTHYKTWADGQVTEQITEADRTRDLYEALLGGREDPRVKEFETQVADWENKYNTINDTHSTLKTEYEQYQKNVNDQVQAEANKYVADFKSDNTDLFSDEQLAAKFVGLLQEGWELEGGAKAARLPAEALQIARQAKADGVPDAYALRLAEGAKSALKAPRPGAKITSGATVHRRSTERAPLDNTKALSFEDLRRHVARNAINSKRRR